MTPSQFVHGTPEVTPCLDSEPGLPLQVEKITSIKKKAVKQQSLVNEVKFTILRACLEMRISIEYQED